MDTDQEREAALREAERVFGNPERDPENQISEVLDKPDPQPEEEQKPDVDVPVEESIAQLLEELGAQINERPIPPDTIQMDDDQPWPDDMQIAKSSVDLMSDTVITLASLNDPDRPTIREKYVFRTQKSRKRQPLPSHLRWMQSLIEGRASKQG